MTTSKFWTRPRLLAGFVAATLVVAGCSSSSNPSADRDSDPATVPKVTEPPNRTLISYGGQFMTSCVFSHQLNDDPIMHPDQPGASHTHEFFGNLSTDASSTYASMIDEKTTCSDQGDRSGYWVPELTIDGRGVEPRRVDAYYRVGEGVAPTDVRPFPDGLAILAGNQFSTEPESLLVAAWTCGLSPELFHAPPKNCTPDRPIQLRLTFPSCWDGKHITSDDHTSHMAYPDAKGCDSAHPVPLPQLTLTVHYVFSGTYRTARLASGNFDTTHGDFLAVWQHKRITDQVEGCLHRQVTCGLVGGTFHTGQGSRDINSYNLSPEGPSAYAQHSYDGGVTTTTVDPGAMAAMGH